MIKEYFVIRLPKEYQKIVNDALKKVKENTGFKITQVEFVKSAIELKDKTSKQKGGEK